MSTRRRFLSAGLIGLTAKAERPIAGGFVNDAFPLGHRLRDRSWKASPTRTERVPVVVVGSGIAGLSAGWWMRRQGFSDFVLLEMESESGGNARSGRNEITRYPWAAHYLPVPNPESAYVRLLCEELGVLQNGKWNERYLCFAPQERLYLHGRWQEGLEPEVAVTKEDRAQYRRFEERIQELRQTGHFKVPMELGAAPDALDRISFRQWLFDQGLTSAHLHWYADYACRDDYGTLASETSAWAGVHYFASRQPEDKGPLTWPEGNAFLSAGLARQVQPQLRKDSAVYSIVPAGRGYKVITQQVAYLADAVIFAAPTFLASYIIEGAPRAEGFHYAPWLTANLTLERLPGDAQSDLAWDNVIYQSPALGYVAADHMSLRSRRDRSVWTYYWALAHQAPATARRQLLEQPWNHWRDTILADLGRPHPNLGSCVSRIDVMRIGHAMVRPEVGFLSSEQRRHWHKPMGRIYFAHSDLSGFSIFEEAQYRGVEAAKKVLALVGPLM